MTVQDAAGLTASQSFTVTVMIPADNHPPHITSIPPLQATAGLPYTYAVVASDPDGWDVLSYRLAAAPVGMTLNPVTHVIQWTPTTDQIGSQSYTVTVEDSGGLGVSQIVIVAVVASVTVPNLVVSSGSAPVAAPNVVNQPQAVAEAALMAAGLTVGTVTRQPNDIVPAGNVISQAPSAGTRVNPGTAVDLVISSGPPPVTLVRIDITPPDPFLLVGQTQAFQAIGTNSDGTGSDLTAQVIWESSNPGVATVNPAGVATTLAPGSTTIRAAQGAFSATTTLTVVARAADTTPPTTTLSASLNDAQITAPVTVQGSATDANFLNYVLDYAPAGQSNFTVLTTGTMPVVNGTLGTFDPTLLLNDIYTLRLRVFD